jgi:hypothetical protein
MDSPDHCIHASLELLTGIIAHVVAIKSARWGGAGRFGPQLTTPVDCTGQNPARISPSAQVRILCEAIGTSDTAEMPGSVVGGPSSTIQLSESALSFWRSHFGPPRRSKMSIRTGRSSRQRSVSQRIILITAPLEPERSGKSVFVNANQSSRAPGRAGAVAAALSDCCFSRPRPIPVFFASLIVVSSPYTK